MKKIFTKILLVFLSIFSFMPEMIAGPQHAIVGWDYGNGKVLYCGMPYMGSVEVNYGTDLINSPDNVQLLDNMVNFLSSTPNATIGIFNTSDNLSRCTILRDTLVGRGYNASLVISTDIDSDVEIQYYDVLLLSGSGNSTQEYNAHYGDVDLTVKSYVETYGGSVLFLGWCVYTYSTNANYQGYVDLMPVETDASYSFRSTYTLDVTIPSSPIFNGVHNNSSQYYGEYPIGNAKTNTTVYAGYKAYNPNNSPVASDVSISGIAGVGSTLTGSYSYSDDEVDTEGTSTFKWYRADDVSGTNTASISGATATEYITTSVDNDKYIAFEVTPVATTGALTGNPVKSSYLYILSVPSAQASETGAGNITKNTMDLGWTRGNGTKCAVFIKEGNSGDAAPENGTTYTANTVFENGTQIGSSGWYCVYNGTGTNVSVTGLSAVTDYQVHVCEYSGGAGSELYNVSPSTNNPISATTLKLDQAITFNSLSDVLFGDADFDLTAVSDLELEIAYSSSDENVAVISGNTITIAGIGITTITASQAGNDTVNAAMDVEQALHVNNTGTVTIAACYEYNFNGDVLSLSGEYIDTIPNSAGTDSIITLNLTILESTASSITTSSCDSYTSPSGKVWTTTDTYSDTIPNTIGCDSIIAIDLTILESTTNSITTSDCYSYTSPGGKVWTASGIYTDTIPNAIGCDSIITVDLTILSSKNSFNASDCNSYTSPSGKVWTATGIYTDTIPNAIGCDSILTVNLTILSSANSINASNCYSYTSPSGKLWTTSGNYTDTIPNAAGCDSIITVDLTILESTAGSITESACESYTSPGGKVWAVTGSYTDTIANAAGCDSIITIDLTILESTTGSITESVNSSYTSPGGKVWTVSGTYTDTIANAAGCDSIITINLTILTSVSGITDNSSIKYYPNPVTNNLNIEFNKQFTGVLKIISEFGVVISKQTVNSTNAFQVNTNELVKGLYIIQLINETDNYILRFVKE